MTCVRVIKHRCCCSLNLLTIIFDVLFSYAAAPPQHSLFNLWLILGHTHRCIRQFRSETPKVSFIMNKYSSKKRTRLLLLPISWVIQTCRTTSILHITIQQNPQNLFNVWFYILFKKNSFVGHISPQKNSRSTLHTFFPHLNTSI